MTARQDPAKLAESFQTLGHANRIRLLEMLRSPRTLQDIRLTPGASRAGANPSRPLARPSVLHHLNPLIRAGLVRTVNPEDDKAAIHEYVGDHSRLFQLSEALRDLTLQARSERPETLETVAQDTDSPARWGEGPKLLLVHGLQEGRVFSLPERGTTRPGWVIGRQTHCDVRLEYDPYVSSENSEIVHEDGAFRLADLRSSRNGTRLNWSRLPIGGAVPLRTGDIIGVGRSLLVFREA